ncbi:MAG: type II toxin-antitoxin system VapC family toxin [Deltaproteobacteria bacterium]|nr:type II toxin-antitoxin system VapC family toxin [Deltaproteobacteria bacterium]
MIVADTNLVAALFLPSDRSEVAEQVWLRDAAWYAPVLWLCELRNVAVRYFRCGVATLAQCEDAMALARRAICPSRTVESDDVLVLRMAARYRLSSYDAEFAALAETLEVPLVTWDGRLHERFPSRAISPEQFLG